MYFIYFLLQKEENITPLYFFKFPDGIKRIFFSPLKIYKWIFIEAISPKNTNKKNIYEWTYRVNSQCGLAVMYILCKTGGNLNTFQKLMN